MSYNGGNVMENKNLQRYEEQGNGCENIIDELIIKTYLNIFSENKKTATGDGRIPSIRQVFLQADYDFDTGCYDVIYQVDKKALTEENIMLLLQMSASQQKISLSLDSYQMYNPLLTSDYSKMQYQLGFPVIYSLFRPEYID